MTDLSYVVCFSSAGCTVEWGVAGSGRLFLKNCGRYEVDSQNTRKWKVVSQDKWEVETTIKRRVDHP